MADLTATLSAVGAIKATLGAGKINVNDYTLTVTPVENGTNISITRGSQTDTVFVPDYAEDEERRVANENARITNEKSRETAEDTRDTEESKRQTAEAARADAEGKRTGAETARATAEADRDAAETARVDAESKRVTAESTRETAETVRVTAEEKRVDAETARAAAEQSRVSAESARATAEDTRVKAESQRQTDTAAVISKADAAAASAQSIADTVQAKLDAGELKGEKGEKGDTGAQGIQGIQGVQGEKGDPGSDAEVTKATVVSALGYEPVMPEGEMVTIVDTEFEENTKKVVYTKDKDGNPFDLCTMIFVMTLQCPYSYVGYVADFTLSDGSRIRCECESNSQTSSYTYTFCGAVKLVGRNYFAFSGQRLQGGTIPLVTEPGATNVFLTSDSGGIVSMQIREWHSDESKTIMAGTKLKIMGINRQK